MLGRAFSVAKMAAGLAQEVRPAAAEQRPLYLCGRSGPLDELRAALLAGPASDPSAVQLFALRRLGGDDAQRLARAAVVVYGGEVLGSLDSPSRQDLEVVGQSGRPILCLLEALDLPAEAVTEAGRVRGVSPADILAYRRGRFPISKTLPRLAERTGSSGPWLAHRLPAFRPHVTEALTERAARRNAKLALAIVVPGADLPALTAVQMRLVLQIAACYGRQLSADRALELMGVLGAGFGLRSVARSMLDFAPGVGWVVQSGVAYAGTKGLGRAAVEYFEHGAVADASKLRALAEGVRVEVERRVRGR